MIIKKQNHSKKEQLPQYRYVCSTKFLEHECKTLEKEKILGIDLECENNLHHYGKYISIIQISSETKNWIIDVINIKDLTPLIKVFQNPNIEKIFHDVNFDFRILFYQFKCQPKNVFDTQAASVLLGKENLGLSDLLGNYFGVKKEKKYQKFDWTRRPLKHDMLSYAIKDSMYLIKLRAILKQELKEKDRLSWAKDEFKHIEEMKYEQPKNTFMEVKGLRLLSEKDRSVFKEIHEVRERLAKSVNRPIHYLIPTRRLKELSSNPPRSINEWKAMKATHPIVKEKAKEFFEAVKKGQKNKIIMPRKEIKKMNDEQRNNIEIMTNLRSLIAKRLNIEGHVVLSKDEMLDISLNKNLNSLRNWQKKLLIKEVKENIKFSMLKKLIF